MKDLPPEQIMTAARLWARAARWIFDKLVLSYAIGTLVLHLARHTIFVRALYEFSDTFRAHEMRTIAAWLVGLLILRIHRELRESASRSRKQR